MKEFDIVIVGAGVAGLCAAAQAAREGCSVAVVEHQGAGGQIMSVERIRNFPALTEGISGYELGPLLQEQAENAGAEFVFDTVEALTAGARGIEVRCSDDSLHAGAVIIASGSARRKLDVPGAHRLEGHGVSHCASCDGPLYKGRTVCVVGGGDSALDEALVLSQYAQTVLLVHRGARLDGQHSLQREVAATGNIRVLPETEVVEVLGDDTVTALLLQGPEGRYEQPADGIFTYIGLAPNSGFAGLALSTDENGRIETGTDLQTSVPGVYAAGDVRAGCVRLLGAVAGDGMTAALAAARHVRGALKSALI
jgi:thioredoxin reductase (NADPH)